MSNESAELAREMIQGKLDPPPVINQTVPLMLAAKERANHLFNNVLNLPGNFTKHVVKKDDIIAEFETDHAALKELATDYWYEIAAIDRDARLSEEAKEEDRKAAKEDALKAISQFAESKNFDKRIERLDTEMINRMVTKRSNNQPKDATLKYLQESEMRSYLAQLRTEAKAQDPKAKDPVLGLLEEATASYTRNHESFIGAVLEPPYPLRVVDDGVKEKALASLKATLSPEHAEQHGYLAGYKQVLKELEKGAVESILGRGATKEGGIIPIRH